ncbi:hypothetical protein B0H14DRAFT_2568923 [Mycena olivaceomarginata]|nr:hypothetical protein B0H14DRAFT_2568923 [Mycena olivaceomarginata]
MSKLPRQSLGLSFASSESTNDSILPGRAMAMIASSSTSCWAAVNAEIFHFVQKKPASFACQAAYFKAERRIRPALDPLLPPVDAADVYNPVPVVILRLFYVHNAGMLGEYTEEVNNYDSLKSRELYAHLEQRTRPLACAWTPMNILRRLEPHTVQPFLLIACNIPCVLNPTINGYLRAEEYNRTKFLFGTKFLEPHKIKLELAGVTRTCILFTFSVGDLAVKLEGNFMLRYRIRLCRIQAECYGGSFRVYATKKAPPLRESTALTVHLAKHSVPVNVRKQKRKSRKRKNCSLSGDSERLESGV